MKSTKKLSQSELKKILKEVIEVSKLAGTKLLGYQKKINTLKIDHKEAQGVVSEADVNTENFIIKKLKNVLTEAKFLAEESCYNNEDAFCERSEGLLWVIDPLDGTTNFLNGMDVYAVCISLCLNGEPLLGVIHRPKTGDTYFAIKNNGAFLQKDNGRAKKLINTKRKSKKLSNCLLATGFATEKGEPFDKEFDLFKNMMANCRGVRRMGSAALDLCFVAEGVFDGFWERGLAPWDVAAASIICSEVGMKVTDYEGRKFSIFGSTIVCAEPSILKNIVKILN
jgi:myo-inositol-1(or 4)-monophosphatase